jgi:hypothetical protein
LFASSLSISQKYSVSLSVILNEFYPLMDNDTISWKTVSKRVLSFNIDTYIYKYISRNPIYSDRKLKHLTKMDRYRSRIYPIYIIWYIYYISIHIIYMYRFRSSPTHLQLGSSKRFTTLRLYIFTITSIINMNNTHLNPKTANSIPTVA